MPAKPPYPQKIALSERKTTKYGLERPIYPQFDASVHCQIACE
jgi:hypothetical protein